MPRFDKQERMTAISLGQPIPLHGEEGNRRIEKILRELGPEIRSLLEERSVIEIMLNADGLLWVDRLITGMSCVGRMPASKAEALICSIAAFHRTTITRENPIFEG